MIARALMLAAAGVAGYSAWRINQAPSDEQSSDEAAAWWNVDLAPIESAITTWWNEATMTNAEALQNANVRAMLRLIRSGEGTADANGYRRLVGGGSFENFSDHPRQKIFIARINDYSTAAGAYQILARTWDTVRRQAGLIDFAPWSQDAAAVQLMRNRGVLADVMAGRVDSALDRLSYEWASLPPFRYSKQGTLSIAQARSIFSLAGGQLVGVPSYG